MLCQGYSYIQTYYRKDPLDLKLTVGSIHLKGLKLILNMHTGRRNIVREKTLDLIAGVLVNSYICISATLQDHKRRHPRSQYVRLVSSDWENSMDTS